MFFKLTRIQWAALVAFIVGIPSLAIFFMSLAPKITIKNDLAFPVKIYAFENEKYQGQIGAFGVRTFRFTSKEIFPVKITWKSVRQKAQNGDSIGEIAQGDKIVDNYRTLEITNTSSENFYFMPIINNETDMTCKIFINDELRNEKYSGLLLPHKENVNAGYYSWVLNSNVTLDCDDGRHWWGERNGIKGPSLNVELPSGKTQLTLRP